MEEHISSIRHLDKTESFVRQFLDRAFCHLRSIAKNVAAAEADLTNSDHSTAFTESNTANQEHKVFAEELCNCWIKKVSKSSLGQRLATIHIEGQRSLDFTSHGTLAAEKSIISESLWPSS